MFKLNINVTIFIVISILWSLGYHEFINVHYGFASTRLFILGMWLCLWQWLILSFL